MKDRLVPIIENSRMDYSYVLGDSQTKKCLFRIKVNVLIDYVSKISNVWSNLVHDISSSSAPFLPKLGHIYFFGLFLKIKIQLYLGVDFTFLDECNSATN